MLKALLKTMRLRQWTKNGFVFFGLIFDKQLFRPEPFFRTLEGFFLFCLISSAVVFVQRHRGCRSRPQSSHEKISPDCLREIAHPCRIDHRVAVDHHCHSTWLFAITCVCIDPYIISHYQSAVLALVEACLHSGCADRFLGLCFARGCGCRPDHR